jgi:hypothetical protein
MQKSMGKINYYINPVSNNLKDMYNRFHCGFKIFCTGRSERIGTNQRYISSFKRQALSIVVEKRLERRIWF